MTSSEDASIIVGDDVVLQIEKIIGAREDVADIIEAAGHTLESFMRELSSEEFLDLLRSIREDLAAHRVDRRSVRLYELYKTAHELSRYTHFSEHRNQIGEYLKEIALYADLTFDDRSETNYVAALDPGLDEIRYQISRSSNLVMSGAQLGPYVLLERFAMGGLAGIHVAYDPRIERKVAIKLLRSPSSSAKQRLLREARAMASISHPNVVRIYDVGEIEEHAFIVEELVTGTTLDDWLVGGPDRHWEAVLEKFIAAGRGLAAVHQAGIIHRDFKPSNVLIDHEGQVLLTDFGLSRQIEKTETHGIAEPFASQGWYATGPLSEISVDGQIVGTPAYMSPEQWTGEELDPRSDQFSFCVALYEALYGHRPFHAADLTVLRESMLKGEVRPPPRHSNVPSQIWQVLSQGLASERAARFPTMHALLTTLERVAARRHQRRHRWAAAAGFLAAGALLASGPMFVHTSSSYSVVWQILALIAAALGGISLEKSLQRRSGRTGPMDSELKAKEEDEPAA